MPYLSCVNLLPVNFSIINRGCGLAVVAGIGLLTPIVSAQDAKNAGKLAVPEDLIEDAHFREEVGINDFTTPSIQKIFAQLGELGPLPFDEVRQDAASPPSEDRLGVALSLGVLIADGFLAVQCERFGEMEALGKKVLDHAELLGTGTHIKPHSKALLENASLQQTEKLKEELAKTQRDVEREMADLRDVDIAHLVSLGGWGRAFQIGCATVSANFSAETARKLARTDIIGYYQAQLETLHPKLQERPQIIAIREQLTRLQELLDIMDNETITAEQVKAWRVVADRLLVVLSKPKSVK